MQEVVAKAPISSKKDCRYSGMVDRRLAIDLDLLAAAACGCWISSRAGVRCIAPRVRRLGRWNGSGSCSVRWRGWRCGPGQLNDSGGSVLRILRQVARSRAKNFYYSFVLLSSQQRKAMCAIYAFMRYCDDLSDEPGASRAGIDRWSRVGRGAAGPPSAIIRVARLSITRSAASASRTITSAR